MAGEERGAPLRRPAVARRARAHAAAPRRRGADVRRPAPGGVNSVAWAPDATRLASAADDGSVRIWDPATGEQLQQLTGARGGVNSVAWAPDATRLASAADDATVRIWDLATGAPIGNPLTGHAGDVNSVAVTRRHPPRQRQQRHHRADLGPRHRRAAPTLTGHTDPVRAVALAPDGTRLASAGGDGTVRVWDPPPASNANPHRPHRRGTGGGGVTRRHPARQRQRRRHGADLGPRHRRHSSHPHRPHRPGDAVARSPDGTRLASASDDGTVRIWDPATGEQLQPPSPATPTGYGGGVAPDGTRLASAGSDGTVRVWDPATGEPTAHPHRPHRHGDRRWRVTRRHPPGQRQHGRHVRSGTPPPATRPPSPATPAGYGRWRHPTAPGSPAPATTARCGSGTPPPASNPPSPATPAR